MIKIKQELTTTKVPFKVICPDDNTEEHFCAYMRSDETLEQAVKRTIRESRPD